ncbi:hypothetical protein [Mucilaginibacter aquaedulcis]|uniref:hypothetical protein n=1 Tax=Mucilaginibacter aquaedulcis TaxID=1187081 RepID=UPI0025B55173|nr:hypothetical protein [Mucilaginibacter aquaedulcis]MDN3548799.1 hypothetical protein [Mucilaginibacter aquaedulcis]
MASNRLFAVTEICLNEDIVDSVSEIFISGNQAKFNTIISGASDEMSHIITEPSSWVKFESFSLKTNFKEGTTAKNDTEMKYIFNFLEKHYNRGDQFTITLKSILYACDNCKLYLQALQNQAMLDGKILKINFIADPAIDKMVDARNLLELN